MNVKCPNNISKWQMGFNLALKGLIREDGWTDRQADVTKVIGTFSDFYKNA